MGKFLKIALNRKIDIYVSSCAHMTFVLYSNPYVHILYNEYALFLPS